MDNKLYSEAFAYFNKGEYEAAYAKIRHSETGLSIKEKQLAVECERLITEQYYVIIKEKVGQKKYKSARHLQEDYISKYNFDKKVGNVDIPDTSPLIAIVFIAFVIIAVILFFIIAPYIVGH